MNKLIVIADDDEPVLLFLEDFLTEEGYQVKLFNEWHDHHIFDFIVESQPALVIVDLIFNLKVLGLNLIRQLQEDSRTTQIPIILTTAAIEKFNAVKNSVKTDELRLLPKPFDLGELETLVKTTIVA